MRVNIRHNYGPGMYFDTDEARARYVREFEAARETARRLERRYVVAPGMTVPTHDSRLLGPGDEVVPTRDFTFHEQQFYGSARQRPVWRQLEDHVFEGRIIDSGFVAPSPPEAA